MGTDDTFFPRDESIKFSIEGSLHLPPVDAVAIEDGTPGRKNHPKNNHDAEEDEGSGHEGDLLQILADKRPGHGR